MAETWECICKFSEHCAKGRQTIQCRLRWENHYEGIENCDFYKLISENLKVEGEVDEAN